MPSSSQPGPFDQPSSSPRRLRSPSERFGSAPQEPEPDQAPETPATQAQAPETPATEAQAPQAPATQAVSAARARKHRHERHRFEREEHRFEPRRAARRKVQTLSANETRVPRDQTSGSTSRTSAPRTPSGPPSPTLARIQAARRRFWRRFTVFFCALSLGGAVAAALFAPRFNIATVTITGLHATSPVLVTPIARRLLGLNVFRAPTNQIAQAVERLPTVAKARVVLRPGFPPRVVLQVRERVPIVRVGDGANWWVADAEGLPYRRANARDEALPTLRWSGEIQTLKPFEGARWSDAERLVKAVQLARSAGAPLQVRQMTLDEGGDATLEVPQAPGKPDLTLRLGNDGWNEKLARARVALAYFERTRRDAKELNLVSLKLPRWTPRPQPVAVPNPAASEPEERTG